MTALRFNDALTHVAYECMLARLNTEGGHTWSPDILVSNSFAVAEEFMREVEKRRLARAAEKAP
jgi:hypothetical protein